MLKTLKGRTALAAAVLAAIGIALVTSLQSNLSERTVLASSVSQHEDYTARVAVDIDRQLRLARASLSELTGNITSQHLADPAALRYFLSSRIGIQQSFESIAVFGADGHLIASRPSMDIASIGDEGWFKATLRNNGTPVIREPFFSALSGEPAVALTYPLHDEMGTLRGVLVGSMALSQEQLLLSPSSAGQHKGGDFVLLTKDQSIVMHPDPAFITKRLKDLGASGATLLRGLQQPGHSQIGPDHRGVRSLYAFAPVASAEWTLVGVAANEEAYASLSLLSKQMLLAGAILAAFLFPAMWLLVSRMLKPLDNLRSEMRRLRSDPAAELSDTGTSVSEELRQLAEEFAQMATAWRAAESALQREKERAEVTLESIADGVIATASDGTVAAMNRAAEKITSWRSAEAIGKPFDEIFSIEDEATGLRIRNIANLAMSKGEVISSARAVLRAKDDALLPIDNSAAPIHTARGEIDGAVVVFRNVAAERAAAQQLEWRATHDLMTGLSNRTAYEHALEQLFDSRTQDGPHSLVMFDLDEFKIVNDTCGHAAGDELLKQLARLLVNRARKTDVVTRLGGDEFAVLMPRCPGDKAMRLAEELRRTIAEFRFNWNGRFFQVGASLGVVEINDSFADAADVQKAADMACYMAKRSGRNRICLHTPESAALDAVRSQMNAVSDIRQAIDEDRLRLYGQPIVALNRDAPRALHFEVLLRMVDPNGNIVPPGAFLPAAERYGLIDELDRWVITHAAQACARRYGPDQWNELETISINLSAATLRDQNIANYIIEQLEQHAIPFDKVCFEVTETAAMRNPGQVGELMHALRAKGLRFALDDFGAGMTSLSQLRDLPIDILKIDGGFIDGVHLDDVNGPVVEAIQMIAHRLSMKTIAERVEQPAELAYLRRLGVDFVQGYLLARPAPIEEVLQATDIGLALARAAAGSKSLHA